MNKSKFYVALGGVLTVAAGLLADGSVSTADAFAILSAVVAAAGVYFVPNKPVA